SRTLNFEMRRRHFAGGKADMSLDFEDPVAIAVFLDNRFLSFAINPEPAESGAFADRLRPRVLIGGAGVPEFVESIAGGMHKRGRAGSRFQFLNAPIGDRTGRQRNQQGQPSAASCSELNCLLGRVVVGALVRRLAGVGDERLEARSCTLRMSRV